MGATDGLSPHVLDTLQRLGLTEYGARCYAALVSVGPAEAAVIADAAEVPRTKVYGVLKDLADGGWAIAEGGRPAKYRAAPPQERVARAEKEIAEASSAAVRELQARHELGAQMVPVSLYLLRGAPILREKTVELVTRARRDCTILLSMLLPGEAKGLAEAARQARRRGVLVRLLVAPPAIAGPLVGLDEFRELLDDARVSPVPFRAVLVDDRQAVIVLPQPDADETTIVGMWNPTEAFMSAIGPFVRAMAERAPPLAR